MTVSIPYILKENTFWLSPERCIYWEEEKALVISDLHFGKTGHFRKSGIPVPQHVYKEDLLRLLNQVQFFKPQKLIVVGDLFHSAANKELELFKKWRLDLPELEIQLVKGNHDILNTDWYIQAEINAITGNLVVKNFCFRHDFNSSAVCDQLSHYTFSGHIHPGIRVNGLAKQSLRFPCFYFTERYCILPAFSRFTGLALIEPKEEETVFAIVPSDHLHGDAGAILKIK